MKLYADEPGADAVRDLGAMAISALSRVEVPSALWRKQRGSRLRPELAGVLVRSFEADYVEGRFSVIAPTDDVLHSAAHVVSAHALRAYDAVQLASALAARDAEPACSSFACFDDDLRRAAAAEGFDLLG